MKDIASAKVIFLNAKQEQVLYTKPNSNCHFFDEFQAGTDIVKLRLDWDDLDVNGFPTLDADFFSESTGKKRKLKGKRRKAHHTNTIANEGRTYEWEFDECKLKFVVVLVFSLSVTEKITVSDSCTMEVVRANQNQMSKGKS